jgi:hypothetical protein
MTVAAALALALAALGLAACPRGGGANLAPPRDEDDPAARAVLVASALDGYHAEYELTWRGRRIGEARERLVADDGAAGGYRFERRERVVVLRGTAIATAMTVVTVELDAAMTARHVRVERDGGAGRQLAEATRQLDDGWRIDSSGRAPRLVDGAAVPSTLVPLMVAARGGTGVVFSGPVLVEGASLALAGLEVSVAPDGATAFARYHTAAGELRAEARLDRQGRVLEAGVGAALGSRRVDAAVLEAGFAPVEIVDASSLVVAGHAQASGPSAPVRLTISGVRSPPPAITELPTQTITTAVGGSWDVTVEPSPPADPGAPAWRQVRERVAWVSTALVDDLRFSALSPAEALAAGRGDCTAHALVLMQDLDARGYETRLVTGFVLDGDVLGRHRWVLVRVGKRWIPVDPMHDEAPARPTHVALAVHGASLDELAFIDDVVFAGWDEAIAAYAR